MTTAGVSIATGTVLPEWIDINDHMNVAFYVLAFDLGVDALWERVGITSEYIETTKCSTFGVECHITYQMELKLDDPYLVTTQILAYDEKRIHQFQRMFHADGEYLAATAEWLNLHIDLTSRRVTPFPEAILSGLRDFVRMQGDLPAPSEAGKSMHINEPIYTGTAL